MIMYTMSVDGESMQTLWPGDIGMVGRLEFHKPGEFFILFYSFKWGGCAAALVQLHAGR